MSGASSWGTGALAAPTSGLMLYIYCPHLLFGGQLFVFQEIRNLGDRALDNIKSKVEKSLSENEPLKVPRKQLQSAIAALTKGTILDLASYYRLSSHRVGVGQIMASENGNVFFAVTTGGGCLVGPGMDAFGIVPHSNCHVYSLNLDKKPYVVLNEAFLDFTDFAASTVRDKEPRSSCAHTKESTTPITQIFITDALGSPPMLNVQNVYFSHDKDMLRKQLDDVKKGNYTIIEQEIQATEFQEGPWTMYIAVPKVK